MPPQRSTADVLRVWLALEPLALLGRLAVVLGVLALTLTAAALGVVLGVLAGLLLLWRRVAVLRALVRVSGATWFCGSAAPVDDPIVTDRLVVRSPHPDDVGPLRATIDDEVRRANGWTPATERAVFAPFRAGLAADMGQLVITDRQGTVVGEAQARPRTDTDAWEIGWWIGPGARGQGYATEAVGALVERLHTLGVAKVVFGAIADNAALRRIATKVGAVVDSTGPHRLPDGSEPASVWFRHEVVAG